MRIASAPEMAAHLRVSPGSKALTSKDAPNSLRILESLAHKQCEWLRTERVYVRGKNCSMNLASAITSFFAMPRTPFLWIMGTVYASRICPSLTRRKLQ